MAAVKLNEKGQIIIPLEIRQRHGWTAGTVLELAEAQGSVQIRTAQPDARLKAYQDLTPEERLAAFDGWIEEFGGILKGRITTDEAMRLTRGDD